jgi:hypothetical protein
MKTQDLPVVGGSVVPQPQSVCSPNSSGEVRLPSAFLNVFFTTVPPASMTNHIRFKEPWHGLIERALRLLVLILVLTATPSSGRENFLQPDSRLTQAWQCPPTVTAAGLDKRNHRTSIFHRNLPPSYCFSEALPPPGLVHIPRSSRCLATRAIACRSADSCPSRATCKNQTLIS